MLTKIKMQTIEHRPNTSVVFWENPSEYSEHIQSTYIDIDVLLTPTVELSEDQLTKTITYIWEFSPGLLVTLSKDQNIIDNYTANTTYNEGAGITREVTKFVNYDPNNNFTAVGTIKNINL